MNAQNKQCIDCSLKSNETSEICKKVQRLENPEQLKVTPDDRLKSLIKFKWKVQNAETYKEALHNKQDFNRHFEFKMVEVDSDRRRLLQTTTTEKIVESDSTVKLDGANQIIL